jgi:hypothetical protein
MRAGKASLALIGLGALWLLSPAPADPSDDLAGPSAGTSQGGGLTQSASKEHAGPAAVSPGDDVGDATNIEIVDTSLNRKIDVVRINSRRGTNNLLAVFAGLKNKTGVNLDIEIETIYKDESGNTLNTGSWIRFTLAAHEEQDYRSSAISEGAVDFLIRVRRARASWTAH